MQGSEHGNRSDGGAGEIGRDILCDAGKTEHVDMQHLAGLLRRFEIRARVIPQAKVSRPLRAVDCLTTSACRSS